MDITIERLREGDEGARAEQVRQAFGRQEPPDPDRPHPGAEGVLGAYAGDRLVAGLTLLDQGQFFGGLAVPSGGIASVAVAADARGNNVARRLMREAFARLRARGHALSVLYPTTASLYRSVGYEVAGIHAMTNVAVGELPSRQPDDHEVRPADFATLRTAYESVAPQYDGWLVRTDLRWRVIEHDFARAKEPSAIYASYRDDELVGAVAYRQVPGDGRPVDLSATHLFARDRQALRSILALLGAHGTMAGTMRTPLPEWQLVTAVDQSQRLRRNFAMLWMLRLLDAPAAIAARGYNPHVQLELDVEIVDDVIAENNGRFVLRVRDGRGSLEPGGRGELRIDVRDLAAAYSGWRSDHAALRAAFCGRSPTLVDFF